MTCVNCFFSSKHQRELKLRCKGDRFENRIKEYKALYLDGVKNLDLISACNCLTVDYQNCGERYLEWSNSFLKNLKMNYYFIEETFDAFISIYMKFVNGSQKKAIDEFSEYFSKIQLNDENKFEFSRLLFRARKNSKDLDKENPLSYFHVPFNKRNKVMNQRFSVSGQPMLYFGYSINCITAELKKKVDNLSIVAFLPKSSNFYHRKISEIKNYFFTILVKSLPYIFKEGVRINYNDPNFRPSEESIKLDIKRSIISEIFTIPVKKKVSFVEEYFLPQLFTSLLIEKNYSGLVFPSTKKDMILGSHIFSNHNNNLALFVDYDENDNYNSTFLDDFYVFLLDGTEKFKYSEDDVFKKIDESFEKFRTTGSKASNQAFVLPLINSKSHIEYLSNSTVKGEKYYDSKEGKIELEFFYKMAEKMFDLIEE